MRETMTVCVNCKNKNYPDDEVCAYCTMKQFKGQLTIEVESDDQ